LHAIAPFGEWIIGSRRGTPIQNIRRIFDRAAAVGRRRGKPQPDEVVGVSLLAPCAFRFCRRTGPESAGRAER
jgi:hypothetical protein